jgi:primosomal protein N' (replication factor Y)
MSVNQRHHRRAYTLKQVQNHHEIAEVLLPVPFDHGFDYCLPPHHTIACGDVVKVPFGKRQLFGIVTELKAQSETPVEKLKWVEDKIDWVQLSPAESKFIDWMAAYTLAPRGAICKMVLSVPAALEPEQKRSRAVPLPKIPDPLHTHLSFSAPQQQAVDVLKQAVDQECYQPFLLDGVTGSGKTEVYFEAIAAALMQGRQVLVLLPEISLTPQWLSRFQQHFGADPVVWNSDLTPTQRRHAWRHIARGEAKVVVGARSALMLPYEDLGLIVVDEEHDQSYKQEEGVIYHARDMAVAKASHLNIPVILVSATPSLETWVNATAQKYQHLKLPDRHGQARFPKLTSVDLRTHHAPLKQVGWLSEPLRQALNSNLERGEQSLLFLNRRGYAPLTLCRSCGHRLQCPNCTTWLVEHRSKNRLLCHHCGFSTVMSKNCPECQEEDSFVACGPGVERVAEEVTKSFPQARVLVMASDAVDTSVERAAKIQQILNHEVDILIGTQMMAKGHHFPMLTLVGIIDADLGLAGGDLRACEKTYQLLHQVAGRSGRAQHPGQVVVQTYHPTHPVMTALMGDQRDAFIDQELEMRRMATMPPFSRLAAVIVSGTDAAYVESFCRYFRRQAPDVPGIEIFGPATAPLAVVRRRHRWRFLIKADKNRSVQSYLRHWLQAAGEIPSSLKLQIDIDPISFL